MEIERKDDSVFILMHVTSNDEWFGECTMAYYEMDKTTLTRWLELKDKLDELTKSHNVQNLTVYDTPYWIEGTPAELELLTGILGSDEEHFGVTQIPESLLESNNCRTEGDEARISTYGVMFVAMAKHTSTELCTWSLSWEFIEECLKNCDPQSVRFIRDDDK